MQLDRALGAWIWVFLIWFVLHRFYLFTHIDFDIKYNGDNVIEINVSTDPQQAVDISEGVSEVKVKFTYSVRWTPTTTTYDKRLQRYERFPLNPVHLEVRRHAFSYGFSATNSRCPRRFTGSLLSTHV